MCQIPTRLTETQFTRYFDPYLSRGARGPSRKLPRYQVFNHILFWLHTGCQWYELPMTQEVDGEKKEQLASGICPVRVVEPGWQFSPRLAAKHSNYPRTVGFNGAESGWQPYTGQERWRECCLSGAQEGQNQQYLANHGWERLYRHLYRDYCRQSQRCLLAPVASAKCLPGDETDGTMFCWRIFQCRQCLRYQSRP